MIKRIDNEYIKVGYIKILLSLIIIILTIFLIYKFGTNFDNSVYILLPFIGIFMCILFSNIITSEIENGTVRYYFTKPKKRYKIFLYKYISVLLYLVFTLAIVFCIYYYFSNNLDIIKFIRYSIPLFTLTTIVLLSSIIFKSSSISTSFSIIIFSLGNIISQLAFGIDLTFFQYTPLPYLDFTIFDNLETLNIMNNELNINLNMRSGIYINIIYSLLFILIGLILFTKKDIKN